MKRSYLVLIAVAVVSILWLGSSAIPAAMNVEPAAEPAKIGVVNISQITTDYERSRDMKDQITKKQQDLEAEFKQKADRIKSLQAELQNFNSKSKDYQDRQKELLKLSYEFEMGRQFNQKMVEADMRIAAEDIYNEMSDVVEGLAKEKKYDLVVARDTTPIQSEPARMALRKVLYNSERLDITNEVLQRLNQAYRLKKVETTKQ
jgi:Skp family chaperone for outer membrane proteins